MPDAYPAALEARLDEPLSAWKWLVKWLLLIPHYVVLLFLWLAFFVMTVVAFFAIVFTGRYPRSIFDFNVGVMRWTWRVSYYGYSALATDRYPPFTLGEVPDYPVQFRVAYPEKLSRGKVWVKWWLLAIPHYIIVGIMTGGAGFHLGLAGILAIVALATVAFGTNRVYPPQLFDLVMGCNRWAARVWAYVALMTDEYPPFRLDQGGSEPIPS